MENKHEQERTHCIIASRSLLAFLLPLEGFNLCVGARLHQILVELPCMTTLMFQQPARI